MVFIMVYKKNEATGNEVNSYMRNEELESYATQIKQTDLSGLRRAHMVRKGWIESTIFY